MATNRRYGVPGEFLREIGASESPANRQGIGDIARKNFAEHHAATTAPRSSAGKLEDLAKLAESERLEKFNPFAAAQYRMEHQAALASAHAVKTALQEAAPERDYTTADVVAVIEATVTP